MDLNLTQLTEHIWLLPHHPDPNAVQSCIGVITSRNESLLVDAGNSPRLARQLRAELERCDLPPVSRILYTHHHWDHIYGACEFGVPVIAHTLCKDILEEESRRPWSIKYMKEETSRNPELAVSYKARVKAVDDWLAFRIVVPEQTFDRELQIHLDSL
jgi:glyoxylase-like metal-dependent hydrolase (beta-lactamase superfamily II)